MQQTQKPIKQFILNFFKNYKTMKDKIKKIWFVLCLGIIAGVSFNACNITRKVTTESSYFQKGDTTCTIIVKSIESYDATKKGM